MNAPQYLIAKYIPDLRRVEPRNIGVVLWTPNGLAARFAAEKPERSGEVDGRSIPSFVTSGPAYKQWIEFWRGELDKPEIMASDQPEKKVGRGSPEFLDILAGYSKGNFVLAQGGRLLDAVADAEDAADYLFSALVDSGTSDGTAEATLDDACNDAITRAELHNDPNFLPDHEVSCKVGEKVQESFKFSYAYRNGSLKRLYQRIPLLKQPTLRRKTVHDAAWTFEKVVNAGVISRENVVSLLYSPPNRAKATDADSWIALLSEYSRVVNLAEAAAAVQEFSGLKQLSEHS